MGEIDDEPPLRASLAKQEERRAPVLVRDEEVEALFHEARVKNTFLTIDPQMSPSLEGFYQERNVVTCPSQHIGRLVSFWEERDEAASSNSPLASPGPAFLTRTPTYASPLAPSASSLWSMSTMTPGSSKPHGGLDPSALVPPPGLAEAWLPLASWAGEPLFVHAEEDVGGETSPRASRKLTYEASGISDSSPERLPVDVLDLGDLPSLGSSGHARGRCRPCAFFHTKGCGSGALCTFCHLCSADERKKRRQVKKSDIIQRRSRKAALIAAAASDK